MFLSSNKRRVYGIYILCMYLFMFYKVFNLSQAIQHCYLFYHIHTGLVVYDCVKIFYVFFCEFVSADTQSPGIWCRYLDWKKWNLCIPIYNHYTFSVIFSLQSHISLWPLEITFDQKSTAAPIRGDCHEGCFEGIFAATAIPSLISLLWTSSGNTSTLTSATLLATALAVWAEDDTCMARGVDKKGGIRWWSSPGRISSAG